MKLCSTCHHNFPEDATECPEHGAKLKHDPLIGTTLGSFYIESWLGEGGMGLLYRAEHTQIKRKAAVKVIKREFLTDATMAGRFSQEARSVAKIGHPHIIDIFDIGTLPDERIYYVMELLEGRSLADMMHNGKLPFHVFAPIMKEACEALEAAHSVGIVHRDLKPDNLFLIERPGEPPFTKVLDFGVAKVLGTDEDVQNKLTRTGSIVGTPQYMAPEQIDGSKVDHRVDVYALGVILFELATGALPFRAETLGGMLKAHLLDVPPVFEPGQLGEGVPPELEAVVFRALAKKASDRYQNVRELREDLERVIGSTPPQAVQWWVDRASSGSTTIDTIPGYLRNTLQLKLPTLADGSRPGGTLHTQLTNPPKKSYGKWIAVGVVVLAAGPVVAVLQNRMQPKPPPKAIVVQQPVTPPKPHGPNVQAIRSKALGVVTEALKDGDPAVRKLAVDALASSKDARHRTLVEPMLADADLQVRGVSAGCLATLGSRAACVALKANLGKDASVDVKVAEALMKLGDDEGRKKLKEILKKGDDSSRFLAALALVDSGDKDARKLLDKRVAAAAPTDPIAIMLLGRLTVGGDTKARAQLASHLEGGDELVQVAVAESLARVGDDAGRAKLSQIAGHDGPARLRAYRILSSLDDQSGYDLFRATFTDAAKPIEDRMLAAQGLGASGEKAALETLSPALDDTDTNVRLGAAGAILAIVAADPKALAAKSLDWATAALSDESWLVRQQAVAVLADADAASAVPLLGKAIHDPQLEVRRAAAMSLGKTKVAAAVPFLGEALDDQKGEVRMVALRSMSRLKDKSAVPLLTKHLAGASAKERVMAAGALVSLGDKTHIAELKDGLTSSDPEIRKLAVEQSAEDPETEKDAVQVALKDKSFPVRFAAASQLANNGSKDGVDVLQEAVKKGGADGLSAYAALGKLGVQPAADLDPNTLLDAADPDVRLDALVSAGKLPPARALSFFKRALRDPDPRIRLAAADGVADLATGDTTKEALALLKTAANDTNPAVSAKAGGLFAKLTPPEPEPVVPVAAIVQPPPVVAAPDMSPVAPLPDMTALPDLTPLPPDMVPSAAQVVELTKAEEEKKQAESRDDAQIAMTDGEVALHAGRYETALHELLKAQKLNPKLPVYFSLGEAYRKIGDRATDGSSRKSSYEKAVESYKKSRDKRAAAYAKELAELIK